MLYIKWFILAILDVLFNVICYLTNPIVVLFANEYGELPSIFRWWANWDDGLDVSWMVYEHEVPSWAEYDFNKHYIYHDEWEAEQITGRHKGFVELIDPKFTLKERFQRYFCRLAWIYRNCAYGFSYYVTGVEVCGADIVKHATYKNDGYMYYTAPNAWTYGYNQKSYGKFHWKIFLGWKIQDFKNIETKRCMLAFCINPWK